MLHHLQVLLNPRSGNGKAGKALYALREKTAERGVEVSVLTTESAGHAAEWLEGADLAGVDAVVAIGGDGTVHEVVNGLMRRPDPLRIPLGVIPAGTGDSLMKDLGAPTVEEAIRDLLADRRRPLDLFRVEGEDGTFRFGMNLVGCGLPARVNQYAESFRAFKGLRYHLGMGAALLKSSPPPCEVEVPETGESFFSDFVLLANTRHAGGGLVIAPDADPGDGKLDLVLVREEVRPAWIRLFARLLRGTHLEEASVVGRPVSEVRLRLPKGAELNIDGEQLPLRAITVKVCPHAIEVLHGVRGKAEGRIP